MSKQKPPEPPSPEPANPPEDQPKSPPQNESETTTAAELESSKHPKAPEKPLEVPESKDPLGTAVDETAPADKSDEPGPDAVQGEKK